MILKSDNRFHGKAGVRNISSPDIQPRRSIIEIECECEERVRAKQHVGISLRTIYIKLIHDLQVVERVSSRLRVGNNRVYFKFSNETVH
jgi:hypothetical protein